MLGREDVIYIDNILLAIKKSRLHPAAEARLLLNLSCHLKRNDDEAREKIYQRRKRLVFELAQISKCFNKELEV